MGRPLLRNRRFGTNPIVVHNHGQRHPNSDLWFKKTLRIVLEGPPRSDRHSDIAVFAWSNETTTGPFEQSCRHLGIDCQVIGREHATWSNRHKLTTAIEALRRCRESFALFADACDVLLVDGLEHLLPLPKEAQMLFMAENSHYPNDVPTRSFEESVSEAPFRYLNAGVCFGRRDRSLEHFEAALTLCGSNDDWSCDQRALKMLYRERYPEIQLDSRCRVFQSLRGLDPFFILERGDAGA